MMVSALPMLREIVKGREAKMERLKAAILDDPGNYWLLRQLETATDEVRAERTRLLVQQKYERACSLFGPGSRQAQDWYLASLEALEKADEVMARGTDAL